MGKNFGCFLCFSIKLGCRAGCNLRIYEGQKPVGENPSRKIIGKAQNTRLKFYLSISLSVATSFSVLFPSSLLSSHLLCKFEKILSYLFIHHYF